MECVHNFLLAKRQNQRQYFDQAHNAKEEQQLDPGHEVLFLSPAESKYIPRTIISRASTLHSYNIEAQGKWYHRAGEHIRHIHLNIFKHPLPQPKTQTPKPSHISKPSLPNRSLLYTTLSICSLPKVTSLLPHSHGPKLQQPNILQPIPPPSKYSTLVDQLLHHLSSQNGPSPSTCLPVQVKFPAGLWRAQPIPCTTPVKAGTESPHIPSTALSSPHSQQLNP